MTMTHSQFIFGDETFLIEDHIQGLLHQAPELEKEQFDGAFELNVLFGAVSTVSLFGQPKWVFVKNPSFLLNKLDDAGLGQLKSVVEAVQAGGHHLIVFCQGKKPDGRHKGVAYLKKALPAREFASFKDWEQDKVLNWIRDRVSGVRKSIDREALFALEELGGVNLRHLASQIEVLDIYTGERNVIVLDDVKATSGGAVSSIFQFNEAVKTRDAAGAILAAERLMSGGDDAIRLMGMLAANLRLYVQIMDLQTQRVSVQEMGKVLGKNPYFLKRLVGEVGKHYTLPVLTRLFCGLAERDFEIKTGRIEAKKALELALLSLGG